MNKVLNIMGYQSIPCLKNNIIISYRRKKAYPNKKVKVFRSYLEEIAQLAVKEYEPFWNTMKSYDIEIDVTYGGQEIDVQNVFDIVCDTLEGITYENDNQIKSCKATKTYEKNTWMFHIRLIER